MRQIVLDTETTGLDPLLGHRIIEIAGVEIVNRRLSGNRFHSYVNPGRDSDDAALGVHGLTTEFLSDKPTFADIAGDFLDFVRDADLVIHNAAFDIAFVDHELRLLDLQPLCTCCQSIVDTLKLAREIHPGKRNSLDALCERHQVSNAARTLHGALLDAQLLAEVYLAMTRGQESLIVEHETLQITLEPITAGPLKLPLVVLTATAEELDVHEREIADILKASEGRCVWAALEAPAQYAQTALN